MVEEPLSARPVRGQLVRDLGREDLEQYGADELRERIEALRAEIARSERQLERRSVVRGAADALFSLPS